MSTLSILDSLNELRESDEMRGLSSILSLFRNMFNRAGTINRNIV